MADIVDDPVATLNGYERSCLFLNRPEQPLLDVAWLSGCDLVEDGRGLGIADFDHDGDLDLVVQNFLTPTKLLINSGSTGNWIALDLVGTVSNPDAIGARIRLEHDGRTQTREIVCGAGYLSMQSLVAHFGLGTTEKIDRIEIFWPSGTRQELKGIRANQRLRIVEPHDASVARGEP
jgi:hypothetical protein